MLKSQLRCSRAHGRVSIFNFYILISLLFFQLLNFWFFVTGSVYTNVAAHIDWILSFMG